MGKRVASRPIHSTADSFTRRDIDGADLANDRQDEDFAISHAPGASDIDDLADNLVDAGIVDPQSDLDLGEKGERIFAVPSGARLSPSSTFSARYGLTIATICFTATRRLAKEIVAEQI